MSSNEKNQPDSLLTESGEKRKENELSLDEAIAEHEDLTENQLKLCKKWKVWENGECWESKFYDDLAEKNRQLADWLKELKSYREHNSIHASSENRVKLEHIECEDAVSRSEILSYIDRIQSQGTGKQKSFEFIQKYVEKMPSAQPEIKGDFYEY